MLFISGESYLDAVMPLQILSLALIVVCLFGWLYNSCALLPCGREKELFWITLVSGLLNVGLNILLIPRFREKCGGLYHPAGRAVLHDALYPLLQGPGHGLS